jgi:hypothetical protein
MPGTPPTSPRFAAPRYADADAADFAAAVNPVIDALDLAAMQGQGILSARPAAAHQGRFYMVQGDGTPANNGIVWWDTGSGWLAVNTPAPVDGAPATPSLRTLGTGAQQAAAGTDARLSDQRTPLDNSVTLAKIAAANPLLRIPGGNAICSIQAGISEPTVGTGAIGFGYTIPGTISFPSTCVFAWVGGHRVFPNTSFVNAQELNPSNCSCAAQPSGNTVQVTVSNFYGGYIYPQIWVYAIGY